MPAQTDGLVEAWQAMRERVQRARERLRRLLLGCCRVALDVRGEVREVRANGPCPCACQN